MLKKHLLVKTFPKAVKENELLFNNFQEVKHDQLNTGIYL